MEGDISLTLNLNMSFPVLNNILISPMLAGLDKVGVDLWEKSIQINRGTKRIKGTGKLKGIHRK